MRIGISCEFISTKKNGTATYSVNLLKGLAGLHGGEHEFVVYISSEEARSLVPQAENIIPRMVLPYNAWARIPFTLPAELVRRPVDLLHMQNWVSPWIPCPLVVTTHDIVWEIHPEMFPFILGTRVRWLSRLAARRAIRVITVSEYSAGDIKRVYKVPADNIRVIPVPIDQDMVAVEDPEELARVHNRYGISGPYILFVGSIEPRKNVDKLIEAYATLKREHDVPHKLVLAGEPVYLCQHVLEMPKQLGIEHDVIFTGRFPDEDGPALFTSASVFAFIGSYEGFGIPPLEAMSRGVPVLAANRTSLPEVMGDAALIVAPDKHEEVVRGLADLLTNEGLRNDLRERGYKRVKVFDPVDIARRVVDVYDECISEFRQTHKKSGSVGKQPVN